MTLLFIDTQVLLSLRQKTDPCNDDHIPWSFKHSISNV